MGTSTSPSSLDTTAVESKNIDNAVTEMHVNKTASPDHDGQKEAASPDPELNDAEVSKHPEAETPASSGPPAAPKITYPNALLASILNIALLLSLFLVALDMVST
jgi:hypothetical protein